jgi:fucose 4-O-acetylase-like acetyltransferase
MINLNNSYNRQKKNKNYGLELLRMLLCYWVVLYHCVKITNCRIIRKMKRKFFHVPTFFFISFYFLFPIIKGRIIIKMKLRLERLLIPYFSWPLITLILNNISFLILKKSVFFRLIPIIELEKQYLFGRTFFSQYWFLFNLIFLSIFFFLLSLIMEINNFIKVIHIFAIISYFFQYSNYNFIFFDKYKPYISFSIGHFVESFPIAVAALSLNYCKILNLLKTSRVFVCFYCIVAIYFINQYNIFSNILIYAQKYHYNGIDKNIFAIFSFIFFSLIEFKSDKINLFISIISNYTLGIYSIHPIVSTIAYKFIHIKPSFSGCFIIYIFSYLVSFLGSKLSFNTKVKYLFS